MTFAELVQLIDGYAATFGEDTVVLWSDGKRVKDVLTKPGPQGVGLVVVTE